LAVQNVRRWEFLLSKILVRFLGVQKSVWGPIHLEYKAVVIPLAENDGAAPARIQSHQFKIVRITSQLREQLASDMPFYWL